uniref:MFS domain-containing protein n=1 Tax=Panagrellus redivivus TaxID=6233 RepID=A0A7E4VEN6_PANRE
MNRRLFIAAVSVSAAGAFHFGFQLVITDPSQSAFESFVKTSIKRNYGSQIDESSLDVIWGALVAAYFVGAIFGSLAISSLSDGFGRKSTLLGAYICCILALMCAIVSHFVTSFELYGISRLLLGFGCALSIGVGPVYLSEISPKHLRGKIGMSTGISVQLGLVVGAVVSMPQVWGTYGNWWIIYVFEAAILMMGALVVCFLPESPVYSLSKSDKLAAMTSIEYFHNCPLDDTIDLIKSMDIGSSPKLGLLEIWHDKTGRPGLIIGLIARFGTAFSGIAAINAFAVDIFEAGGLGSFSASWANTALSFASFLATLAATTAVERFGRRFLMLIGSGVLIACNVVIVILLYAHEHTKYKFVEISLVIVFAVFLIFFAIGPGPICYFINAELNDSASRGAAQSWTSCMQQLCRAILLFAFLPVKSAVGASGAFLVLFIGPLVWSTVYLYYRLPETKNRSSEVEIMQAKDALPAAPRWISWALPS